MRLPFPFSNYKSACERYIVSILQWYVLQQITEMTVDCLTYHLVTRQEVLKTRASQ